MSSWSVTEQDLLNEYLSSNASDANLDRDARDRATKLNQLFGKPDPGMSMAVGPNKRQKRSAPSRGGKGARPVEQPERRNYWQEQFDANFARKLKLQDQKAQINLIKKLLGSGFGGSSTSATQEQIFNNAGAPKIVKLNSTETRKDSSDLLRLLQGF